MPEMKGIIPGSFYQLFGEKQHLGSCCLIIWGAQREHCVRRQICSEAGSIWWWDAYLTANEMPGGVTVICYHPPPPLWPPPNHRHKPTLYEWSCRYGIGCTSDLRGKMRAVESGTLHAKAVPVTALHLCMHTRYANTHTHTRREHHRQVGKAATHYEQSHSVGLAKILYYT